MKEEQQKFGKDELMYTANPPEGKRYGLCKWFIQNNKPCVVSYGPVQENHGCLEFQKKTVNRFA